jgi:hypothetical protein
MLVAKILARYDLPTTDGYALICVAEDYARHFGISVDNVYEAALASREYANHLISVMKKRQKELSNV